METADIKEILKHEIDSVSVKEKVEITLRDFILLYKTIEELRRFFHNPEHLKNKSQVELYIGNKNTGMYSLLDELYRIELDKLLTPEIELILESDKLDSGKSPFYFK